MIYCLEVQYVKNLYREVGSKIVLIAARDMSLASYSGARLARVNFDGKKMEVEIYDHTL